MPPVGADDVLVRMQATSVNTPDWATVTGVPYMAWDSYSYGRPQSSAVASIGFDT